jgi:hypothetical protein
MRAATANVARELGMDSCSGRRGEPLLAEHQHPDVPVSHEHRYVVMNAELRRRLVGRKRA